MNATEYRDKAAPNLPEPDLEAMAKERVQGAIECLNADLVRETDLLRLQTALDAARTALSAAKAQRFIHRPFWAIR